MKTYLDVALLPITPDGKGLARASALAAVSVGLEALNRGASLKTALKCALAGMALPTVFIGAFRLALVVAFRKHRVPRRR